MTDSGSQSDETTSGTASTGCGADLDGREPSVSKYRRRRGEKRGGGGDKSEHGSKLSSQQRKKKGVLNAKERNIRRLESNERERKRMHDLNNQFQVMRASYCNNYPPLSIGSERPLIFPL